MRMEKHKFNAIDEAIDDITKGKMVILVDDEDRENRGRPLHCGREDNP